jgi:hypothetical protein
MARTTRVLLLSLICAVGLAADCTDNADAPTLEQVRRVAANGGGMVPPTAAGAYEVLPASGVWLDVRAPASIEKWIITVDDRPASTYHIGDVPPSDVSCAPSVGWQEELTARARFIACLFLRL